MSESPIFNGQVDKITRVASVLVNPNGNIPLGRQRANGNWALPKGAIDPRDHETSLVKSGDRTAAHEAALREINEEVGIRPASVGALRSLGVAARASVFRLDVHHTEYFTGVTFKTRRQGLRPVMTDEISEAGFFSIEEARDRLQNPTDAEVLTYGYDLLRADILPDIPPRVGA